MSTNVNPFKNIQISLTRKEVIVQYSIDPAFPGRAPFKYELLAFEDETFDKIIYTIPSSTFYVVDDTNQRQNAEPSYFYKLRLTDKNNVQYLSNFFGWHPSDSITQHHYLIASEISRRERIRFNYAGLFAYILKRKDYSAAQACEVDDITGEPITDGTDTYGVGTLGGYYAPVLTRLSIENRDSKQDYDENGRGTQNTEVVTARSAGFPFIDQHDLIVTPDGKRFTVTNPNSKYFPGTTLIILQMAEFRLIPVTDTTYNIPVPPFPINE
jgi:hypothetical protein